MKRTFTLIGLALLMSLPCYAQASHYALLTWNAGTGGDSNPSIAFNVYRGTTAGGESINPLNATPLDVGCTTACAYTDNNVVAGQIYFYIVRATLNGVLSSASNEASTTIPFTLSTPQSLSISSK
jgi:hypothetical protein